MFLTNPVDGVKEERPKQQQPTPPCLADLTAVNLTFCARLCFVFDVLTRFDLRKT